MCLSGNVPGMKTALPLILIAAMLAAIIWIAGVRVIVVPPSNGSPQGRTIIAAGLVGYRIIDSASAACARRGRPYDGACEVGTLLDIARNSTVIVRLPYMGILGAIARP